MSARAQAAVSWGSLACAALASLLYWFLVWHTFRDSWFYEGWIFLAQLGLAAIALVLAVIGIRKHPVVCVVGAVVSGYLLLIQLVL